MNKIRKPAVKRDPVLGAWVALVDVEQAHLASNYDPRQFGISRRYGYGFLTHTAALRAALRAARGESK